MPNLLPILLIAVGFWHIAALPAHAYVDPGTGSMLWQVLLSAMLGMGYAFRTLFRRKPADPSGDRDQE